MVITEINHPNCNTYRTKHYLSNEEEFSKAMAKSIMYRIKRKNKDCLKFLENEIKGNKSFCLTFKCKVGSWLIFSSEEDHFCAVKINCNNDKNISKIENQEEISKLMKSFSKGDVYYFMKSIYKNVPSAKLID